MYLSVPNYNSKLTYYPHSNLLKVEFLLFLESIFFASSKGCSIISKEVCLGRWTLHQCFKDGVCIFSERKSFVSVSLFLLSWSGRQQAALKDHMIKKTRKE